MVDATFDRTIEDGSLAPLLKEDVLRNRQLAVSDKANAFAAFWIYIIVVVVCVARRPAGTTSIQLGSMFHAVHRGRMEEYVERAVERLSQ